MFPQLQHYCEQLVKAGEEIPQARKDLLLRISEYIKTRIHAGKPCRLMFVCTHNSRRSQFGQVWAAVASEYFGFQQVHSFSGGTEATAFHPNALRALQQAGLEVKQMGQGANPHYHLFVDSTAQPLVCFSKVVSDAHNPQLEFAAIMTCSDAEQNCPFIPGVDLRIGTTYEDPKVSDGTDAEVETYAERCKQIGTELFYVFNHLK